MSKRPPGSFFRDRKKKIEAEKIELAKQWEKTRKNWLKCENVENKSDDTLNVDVNEVNIEKNDNENTNIKEPLSLTSCNSNLNKKCTVNDLDFITFNLSENCRQVNENTVEISLTDQNKYEHLKATNFPEILFDNPRSWSPINDKLRCILILHGPNRGITAPKPFNNHWFSKQMNNGEKLDRTWMMYSEPNEAIFCFCCILFGTKSSALTDPKQGFTNWKKMEHLREHKNSSDHVKNFLEWKIFEKKFKKRWNY